MPPEHNNILEYKIPHQHHHAFATYGQFQNFLQQSASEWEAEAGSEPEETNKGHQYLAIHKTRAQLLSRITEKSIRANLPRMRLHYDAVLDKLIVKLVNIHYDIAATGFSETFLEHCQATTIGISRRDLVSLRARSHSYSSDGGQGLLGFNEPDDAFKPKNTRPRADDRPSMVFGNWQLRLSQPVLSSSSNGTGDRLWCSLLVLVLETMMLNLGDHWISSFTFYLIRFLCTLALALMEVIWICYISVKRRLDAVFRNISASRNDL